MSAPTGIAPVKQAIVKMLRTNATLKAAVSNEFHEAVALPNTDYPFVVYQVAYSVQEPYWGGVTIRAAFDVYVISGDQVEAHNLDQLILETLHDASLDLGSSGQTLLYCRRTSDLSFAGLDESGQKIYQMGGSYAVWTDQKTA